MSDIKDNQVSGVNEAMTPVKDTEAAPLYNELYADIRDKLERIDMISVNSKEKDIHIEAVKWFDFAVSVANFITLSDDVDGKYNSIIIRATEFLNKIKFHLHKYFQFQI